MSVLYLCFYLVYGSNRTLTAKFTVPNYQFFYNFRIGAGAGHGTLSHDILKLEDPRDIDPVDESTWIFVSATPAEGYKIDNWQFEKPTGEHGYVKNVNSSYINDLNQLVIKNGEEWEQYGGFPSETTFSINFLPINPTNTYTVTIKAAEWQNGWLNPGSQGTTYYVGWWGENANKTSITKTFKEGEKCKFWVNPSTCLLAITDSNNSIIERISFSTSSYEFTVTKNITLYASMVPERRDE